MAQTPKTPRPSTGGSAIAGVRSAPPEKLADKTAEALGVQSTAIKALQQNIEALAITTAATKASISPSNTPLSQVSPNADWSYLYEKDGSLTLTGSYGVPIAWPGIGVHAYVEEPDQSTLATFTLNGTVALNGSAALNGAWSPVDKGRFPYSASSPLAPVIIKGLPAVTTANTKVRVYLNTYSATSENQLVRASQPGATPSVVITVQPLPSGPGGVNYAQNVSNFAVTTNQTDDGGGKLTVFFTVNSVTPPSDPNYAGYDLVLYGPAGTELHRWAGSPLAANWPAPAQVNQQWTLYADSYNKAGVRNTIEFGVTPSVTVIVGTASGTLNLGYTQLASVSAAMAVVNGVLGVGNKGITTSLINDFAVASAQLADAAVATQKLADGAVTGVKIANATIGTANIQNAAITSALIQNAAITTALIANAAITNALIANAAITDAKISDLSVNKLTAGTISAISITSSASITTTNGTDSVVISPVGANGPIAITDGTANTVQCYSNLMSVINVSSLKQAKIQCDTIALGIASLGFQEKIGMDLNTPAFKCHDGVSLKTGVTTAGLTLAKITPGGSNGSIDITGGVVTAFVAPT